LILTLFVLVTVAVTLAVVEPAAGGGEIREARLASGRFLFGGGIFGDELRAVKVAGYGK